MNEQNVIRQNARSSSITVAAAAVMLFAAGGSGAATFTVGAEAGCSSNSIPGALLLSALNGPGLDVIRVAGNQGYTGQHIVVSNQSVSLIGGYSNCSDSTGGGQTVLSGSGGSSDPVIEITGTANGTRQVELVNFEITGGEEGGVVISGSNIVSIQDSLITGNQRGDGGGIWLDGADGAILTLTPDAAVIANTATNPSSKGGGIYCQDGGFIVLEGLVANNDGWFGGGVFLSGCTMNDFAGGTLRGIVGNTGTIGGGIFAAASSVVNLFGTTNHPAIVSNNVASFKGGGAWIQNDSSLTAKDSWIFDNDAGELAGGVGVSQNSAFTMDRTYGSDCHTAGRCSQLSGNRVTGSPNYGGAVYVEAGCTGDIRQTYIEGNDADFGSAAWVEGAGAQLLLEGDILAGNQGESVIYQHDQALVRAAYVTSTRNTARASGASFYSNASGDTVTEIYSSIIDDPLVWGGGVGGASHTYDCVIVRSVFGMPAAGDYVLETDPMLLNPAVGDYHLSSASPAIDYCDTILYTPAEADIDGQSRGTDLEFVGNVIGPFDLGADEWSDNAADSIFEDGFESGSTSAWSNVSP